MEEGFFYKRRLLYVLWLLCVIFGSIIVIATNKGDTIQFLNQFYNDITVPIFTFFTHLGEWVGILIPFLYFLFFKPLKYQVGFIMVALATLVLVYFFKQIVYPDAIRPIVFFEQQLVDIVNRPEISLNRQHTFPSGHTTAGFAYFFYAALCADKRFFQLLFLGLAFMVGLSRIFLIQHFVSDVVAGSVLGVAIASVIYYFVIHKNGFKASVFNKKLFYG